MNKGKAIPCKFPLPLETQIRNSWPAMKQCSKVWLLKLQYKTMQILHNPVHAVAQLLKTHDTLSLDAVLGHQFLRLLSFWLTTEIFVYSHYSFLQVSQRWLALGPFFRIVWHWQKSQQEEKDQYLWEELLGRAFTGYFAAQAAGLETYHSRFGLLTLQQPHIHRKIKTSISQFKPPMIL